MHINSQMLLSETLSTLLINAKPKEKSLDYNQLEQGFYRKHRHRRIDFLS